MRPRSAAPDTCNPPLAACDSGDVTTAPAPGGKAWPTWTVVIPTVGAGLAAALLGSLGWFVNSFGIGSDCTDKFSCGGPCAPCDAQHQWITAGGTGQWLLVVAAGALLSLGLRHASWRRALAAGSSALLPASIAWYAVTTVIAEHSF
jgi:hypothetical protein